MEPKEELLVFCDGGARGNPGPGGAACVIWDQAGKKRFLCGKYFARITNNKAEYAAVKLALELIKKNYEGRKRITFFLDSKLVVNQLGGIYKVKDSQLRELIFEIRQLESSLGEIYYQHVSRDENKEADRLVNRTMDEGEDFEQVLGT